MIDLDAGDAVLALQSLWKEVREYENLRTRDLNEDTEQRMVEWRSLGSRNITPAMPSDDENDGVRKGENLIIHPEPARELEPLTLSPISSKPWFVVATKADKDNTQQNFAKLQAYITAVEAGQTKHPSGRDHGWRRSIAAIPVSALRGEGVNKIPAWVASLLDSSC